MTPGTHYYSVGHRIKRHVRGTYLQQRATSQTKKKRKKETHVYNSVHSLFVMGMSVGIEFETRHPFIKGKIPTPPQKNTTHVRVYSSDHACW